MILAVLCVHLTALVTIATGGILPAAWGMFYVGWRYAHPVRRR